MFNKELEFFINNQDKLVKLYPNKVLILKDQKVVGAYDTPLEAYIQAQTKYKIGTFMIQPCEAGPQAYTITISSQEIFA